MFADLHLHSAFSDGTFSPEQLAQEGHQRGLAVLALTDHDTMEGCARLAAACQALAMECISGTELTAELDGAELHILGYFLQADDPHLRAEMSKFQNVRQDRIREMVSRLNELGIPLEAEAVFKLANCRSPGRPHVGRALVEAGFCASQEEAFERFLKRNRPAWVPKFRMSALETIQLIHRAGGVAVLAHPGLNRSDDVIEPLVEAGLDGLECYHSRHSPATSEHYVQMAERLELLITGGSDCHGFNKGRPLIGTIKLPYSHVEEMRAVANQRRSRLRMAGV
ncbi:MAG: PHP domain-containing protein [Verrucomicrobiae bacterium]|nr:PHP domain-containing protein [Verrucomicrobiae bacterium]